MESIVKQPESRRIKAGRVSLGLGEEVGSHITENREEVIVVVKGEGVLERNGQEEKIKSGGAYFVGEGIKHNVRNTDQKKLEYVYVTAGLD